MSIAVKTKENTASMTREHKFICEIRGDLLLKNLDKEDEEEEPATERRRE